MRTSIKNIYKQLKQNKSIDLIIRKINNNLNLCDSLIFF
jgi:hypothetical protein